MKEKREKEIPSKNTFTALLKELRDAGEIAGERGVYRTNKFTDQELRLLIDGVMFGQHIPKHDAKLLIDKLKAQSEMGLADHVRSIHYLEGINRTQNSKMISIIDTIDEAIQKRRQVRVELCRYNSTKKLVSTGRILTIDPYYLVSEKSRYYVICYVNPEKENSVHGKGLENLRVDRFLNSQILESASRGIDRVPGYENSRVLQLDKYMKEHIYMFSGDSAKVKLKIKKYNIGDFIDWFGTDFRTMTCEEDDYMYVLINVNENAIKYWALQYGGMATVMAPERLRLSIKSILDSMEQNYSGN